MTPTPTTCPCCGGTVDRKLPIVDLDTNVVSYGAFSKRLRPTQIEFLHALVRRAPGLVSKEAMLDAVYGIAWPDSKALDVHLSCMRKALRGSPIHITTHWGRGWSLHIDPIAA